MPTQRVGSIPIAIHRFDVIGLDASSEPGFVEHVALAAEEREDHVASEALPVDHMRPPLERPGECHADCVGSAGLTVDEQLQIGLFSDEVESEYGAAQVKDPRRQYVICPHVDLFRSEDQTVIYRRFSCVGFVLEAYREARIDVLWTDFAPLPLVGLDALKVQYPRFARRLDNPKVRNEFGLGGDGPWPVILAGYVLNALARPEKEIRTTPYLARAGDEFFPPRRPAPSGQGPRSIPWP